MVRGTAHAEIKDWEAARELFAEAAEVAPEEPAAVFDLALAFLRTGANEEAGSWLDRVPDSAPAEARARAELLRGRLALEAGNATAEAAAYRRAAELDPLDPVYPYALSQVLPRLEEAIDEGETGRLLRRAHELWPTNSRLRAELAQWLLRREEDDARREGLALLEELVRSSRREDLISLLERGRAELAGEGPLALRRALNLLRPGKRFQQDSADLEARLQVMPYDEPLTAELRSVGEVDTAATLVFSPESLLPELPLAAGETVLDVTASNDAVNAAAGRREADLTLVTDRAIFFLARDAEEPERLATGTELRQAVVGELDGDGWMEIIAFGRRGVRVFGRSGETAWSERTVEPVLAGADLRHPLLVDFEHDGDLDLLAVDPTGRILLVTHRGEAGWGAPEPAPLPVARTGGPLAAVDLDGDADQDLVVATESGLEILTNWRQGEFIPSGLLAAAPVESLVALDRDGDGRTDLAALTGGTLSVWRNDPERGLLAVSETTARASALAVADLDLDGDLDLVTAEVDDGGVDLVVWTSGPGASTPSALATLADSGITGSLALDLDGDRSPDLMAWGPSGIATLASGGAGERLSLVVGLRGLAGKVPMDGRGARVTVSWGVRRQILDVERPEVLIGLGDRRPALVKVTWPNGISEYLHEPAPGERHTVEQVLRIEGSCPFLYAWDGTAKRFVTDILGLAPLGMLAAPGVYVVPDPEEYLRLPDWVTDDGGSYRLSITEELREVAYIDQIELVVVDTPPGVVAYNGERWIPSPVEGLDLRLLAPLEQPVSVLADTGDEVLERVAAEDREYLTNHRGRRLYQGAVPPHSLTIELPPEAARAPRPALVLVGWLHWANTSVNVARAQDPGGRPLFPLLEVPDGRGGWRSTTVAVGLPAGKTKPIVVDLTGVVDPEDPRVRLTTDFEVYWDRIAVTRALGPETTPPRRHRLAPRSAELGYGGFSRWYRPAANGPYLFDYRDREGVPLRGANGSTAISWHEHQGFYTAFGTVTARLRDLDDRLVVFGSGEELELEFDASALPPLAPGWSRTLFLHTEGWEKDGDPNVACAGTVGPLPFRGMTSYPCPGVRGATDRTTESTPDDHGRWVDGGRLERRVRAWSRAERPGVGR